jgi:homoserine O-succinyltransferase
MPLIKNSELPAYKRLEEEGRTILPEGRAMSQDIRELHIGFCNMMPDAAVEATERQFFRLIGESNKIAQFYIHPFTLPVGERSKETRVHFDRYYEPFEKLQKEGLDALIVTGASEETNPNVSDADFWHPLRDLISWAHENVTSTLCSCLASHAVLNYIYNQRPRWRETKQWGVYRHRVNERHHPMVRGMNTVFDVPHSRYSEITKYQFETAGMRVLAESAEAGVHVACSSDGLRLICLQGHPEYDTVSLLKEYKREVFRYFSGEREDCPPFPDYYFGEKAGILLEEYRKNVKRGKTPPEFPEEKITPLIENTWTDSGRAMLGNWVGLVYQLTNVDRKKPFMNGVDPENPLGLYPG